MLAELRVRMSLGFARARQACGAEAGGAARGAVSRVALIVCGRRIDAMSYTVNADVLAC